MSLNLAFQGCICYFFVLTRMDYIKNKKFQFFLTTNQLVMRKILFSDVTTCVFFHHRPSDDIIFLFLLFMSFQMHFNKQVGVRIYKNHLCVPEKWPVFCGVVSCAARGRLSCGARSPQLRADGNIFTK